MLLCAVPAVRASTADCCVTVGSPADLLSHESDDAFDFPDSDVGLSMYFQMSLSWTPPSLPAEGRGFDLNVHADGTYVISNFIGSVVPVGLATGAAAGVPEPGSLLLVLAPVLALCGWGLRRYAGALRKHTDATRPMGPPEFHRCLFAADGTGQQVSPEGGAVPRSSR